MLRLNDSTGVNWWEETLDDPVNPGGGLEVVSPVVASIRVLTGSQMKSPQSSIEMLLYRRSLGSECQSPLAFR